MARQARRYKNRQEGFVEASFISPFLPARSYLLTKPQIQKAAPSRRTCISKLARPFGFAQGKQACLRLPAEGRLAATKKAATGLAGVAVTHRKYGIHLPTHRFPVHVDAYRYGCSNTVEFLCLRLG